MFSISTVGIIHENSDRERKSAQGHDIDGLAQRAEAENADENGQRIERHDQRAFPVSEKSRIIAP